MREAGREETHRDTENGPRPPVRRNLERLPAEQVQEAAEDRAGEDVGEAEEAEEERHVRARGVPDLRVEEDDVRGPEEGGGEGERVAEQRGRRERGQ